MKKNKLLPILLVLSLILALLPASAAAEDEVNVYVTVSKGSPVVTYEYLSVYDMDGDGAITVNDALILVHAAYYDGSDNGYAYAKTEYGLSITRLWGDESGAFGYYVNNAAASDLAEPLKDGDYVYAYVYTDTQSFSDTYCYFDQPYTDSLDGNLTLTLTAAAFDEAWNPITVPVAGASILVDGKESGAVTDENGTVSLSVKGGRHIISASGKDMVLVPPVCIANVALTEVDESTETAETVEKNSSFFSGNTVLYIILAAAAVITVVIAVITKVNSSKKKKRGSAKKQ